MICKDAHQMKEKCGKYLNDVKQQSHSELALIILNVTLKEMLSKMPKKKHEIYKIDEYKCEVRTMKTFRQFLFFQI